jgi:hypothetical protein
MFLPNSISDYPQSRYSKHSSYASINIFIDRRSDG